MNKRLILPIIVISLFILAGCKGGTAGKQGPATGKDSGFAGGTNALLIDFIPDSPPAEVFDGGDFPFDVVVKLENAGEFTVPKNKVKVSISGINPSEFNVVASSLVKNPPDDLVATRKDSEGNIIKPGPVFVEFNDFNHVQPLVTNNNFKFRADVCYLYQTIAESKICIRPNNLETDEGVCKVTEDKDLTNSGGPIQVNPASKLKETARAKEKVGFTFVIKHMGNGNIFQKESGCPNNRTFENKVHVEVSTGLAGLECSGLTGPTAGYVSLFGEDRLISCTQATSTTVDFVTPVVIKLAYDYEENKEVNVLVKHQTE